MQGGFFSNLALRAGFGRQGNQAVRPYGTQLLLRTSNERALPFGSRVVTGFAASQVANPTEVGDVGAAERRASTTASRTTASPARSTSTRRTRGTCSSTSPGRAAGRWCPRGLENIGSIRNRGLEATFDAGALSGARPAR
jgi:iron complex outermembrane receptor protein